MTMLDDENEIGEKNKQQRLDDKVELAESLNDLFLNISSIVKTQLQGCNNGMEVLDKMNARVSQEYQSFADLASGLNVFVHQLKSKSANYNDYVDKINVVEQQLTHFEALVSSLDQHVSLLESTLFKSLFPTKSTSNS